MTARTLLRLATFTVAAACSTGCAIHVDLPDRFLTTEETRSEFKATTPDDAILWIEELDLPAKGDKLDFWVAALENDFVANRGYVLVDDGELKTDSGLAGKRMVFETTTQGQTYRYLVVLFVDRRLFGPVLVAARYTAAKDAFDRDQAEVLAALRGGRF